VFLQYWTEWSGGDKESSNAGCIPRQRKHSCNEASVAVCYENQTGGAPTNAGTSWHDARVSTDTDLVKKTFLKAAICCVSGFLNSST